MSARGSPSNTKKTPPSQSKKPANTQPDPNTQRHVTNPFHIPLPATPPNRTGGTRDVKPILRSAVFDASGSDDDDDDNYHWTFRRPWEPSKYGYLNRLPHKLGPSNYVSWMTTIKSALETVELFEYCKNTVPLPPEGVMSEKKSTRRWQRANALVRGVLTANMTEEAVNQLSHLNAALDIWREARQLFSGQTMTDFTLTITALVTTKYVDGEDLTDHIARMKALRRDLVLMQRNIDDDIFACFLRISMPPTWNYVFSGLPDKYTSTEVERRIKDEYGVRTNQATTAAAYNVRTASSGNRSKHIDIKYHWIREKVEDGTFLITHCPTSLMIADGFTKPLSSKQFTDFVDNLGLKLLD